MKIQGGMFFATKLLQLFTAATSSFYFTHHKVVASYLSQPSCGVLLIYSQM